MLETIILIVCPILWILGGQKWGWARDVFIPLIVGLYFTIHHGLLLGILTFGASNIIRMGYGAYDPENDPEPSLFALITQDRNGWVIRSIVGALYGISLLSVLWWFYHTHIDIVKGICYTLQCSLISYLVCRLRLSIIPTDILVGLSFISIVLYF